MPGDGHADVFMQFLKDIDQRWRRGDVLGNGETEAMGLTGAMIGVLAQQDDLYLVEGRRIEGIEDKAAGGVDGLSADLFVFQQGDDLQEIGFREFLSENLFPAVFDLYVHTVALLAPKVNKTMGLGRSGIFFIFAGCFAMLRSPTLRWNSRRPDTTDPVAQLNRAPAF